ncbi:MAG: DNA primase [Haloferacaceae archaeon]
MNRRHARYPFFEAAREQVRAAEVTLPELVAADAPAVDRGRERVERALLESTVAPAEPSRWEPREELLSYPIARVLVSLIDSPAAVEKYAAAEAATAIDRLREDLAADDADLRSTTTHRVDLSTFLREFDLDGVVEPETGPRVPEEVGTDSTGSGSVGSRSIDAGGARSGERSIGGGAAPSDPATARWFRVDVAAYLQLKDDRGERWRLVNRELADGAVRVEHEELFELLESAVRQRVAEGLPFDVTAGARGEEIADALAPTVADLRELLDERGEIGPIDRVVPKLFPPCMTRLVERARRGVEFDPHESFALMAFLTAIGMTADEIVEFCRTTSLEEEGIRYQTEYLRDDGGTQYPPPSCETLHAYGLCDNEDDHWEVAGHPLVYYRRRLDAADEGELTDWREREDERRTA